MIGETDAELRLTFRNKAGDVCWQKQLRDKHLSEGVPAVPHLDIGKAIVREVNRKLAEQIILKYEWLGTLPNCSKYFGLFFGNYCAGVTGVLIGGCGANLNSWMEFGLSNYSELAYLARGANVHWSPPGANSKLVSWTCKLLSKRNEAKLIIAYSDTDAGEIGTIYQACNWICIGKGSSTNQWIDPSGTIWDQKLPYDLKRRKGGTRAQWCDALRKAGWREQKSNPKYRYVYVLDKTDKPLIARVEKMRVDYPKRGTGETDNAGQSNDQTGGASPTVPLLDLTGGTPELVTEVTH